LYLAGKKNLVLEQSVSQTLHALKTKKPKKESRILGYS
jgi:hypothetical protein